MGRNAFFIANPDDANLPVITSARRSEGWGYKRIREVSIHIAPDGTEYVYAKPNEKADLIYSFADEDHPSHGLPDVRLRKLGTSSKARKLEKEIKKAEEIKKATVARKVARRIRRKGGG